MVLRKSDEEWCIGNESSEDGVTYIKVPLFPWGGSGKKFRPYKINIFSGSLYDADRQITERRTPGLFMNNDVKNQ